MDPNIERPADPIAPEEASFRSACGHEAAASEEQQGQWAGSGDEDARHRECGHSDDTGSAVRWRAVSGRDVAALLNPRPVAVIGAVETGGGLVKPQVDFATVAWITPLSHEPPLLAFALRPSSKTYATIAASRCFSVNTLDAALVETARFCGNVSGYAADKGAQVAYTLHEHQACPKTNAEADLAESDPGPFVPYVRGGLSVLDCEVESIRSVGDHELVVAYVCKAVTRCAEDRSGSLCSTDTLLCLQHHVFASLDEGYPIG